jgi:hypothetical protein
MYLFLFYEAAETCGGNSQTNQQPKGGYGVQKLHIKQVVVKHTRNESANDGGVNAKP